MEKIIVFLGNLIKNKNKYAYIFNKNEDILKLKDLISLNKDNLILNGLIKNSSEIAELWDIQSISFDPKNKLDKNKEINKIKIKIKIKFKLRLRKIK